MGTPIMSVHSVRVDRSLWVMRPINEHISNRVKSQNLQTAKGLLLIPGAIGPRGAPFWCSVRGFTGVRERGEGCSGFYAH